MTITFITGGNTGLGYESAKRLKRLGHKVYIGSRNEEKGKKAANELNVEYIVIDVTDEESVKKLQMNY
ncbi:NAD(P)-dependent dehydrogenase (short-subunit alcohol dehydrogenase family) [Breznakia pachnodae]|uniref:NAD(P)-dependent dehydrogenase (Short-subunit alcohol dehydrogenase family) n=1 Tax=Breznakia pachnodae TaxID=265178 RepID=A0ABU0E5B5_9FIRM|nr:SDR family NAD(P)-dependent oxidoreductase [Breznakia pachnodae]MDQ0362098.1 NAD(P)-dependent dehydrogenase (short-subunit alcohol dehydrogenase family) [Breznakia pachnodae]